MMEEELEEILKDPSCGVSWNEVFHYPTDKDEENEEWWDEFSDNFNDEDYFNQPTQG